MAEKPTAQMKKRTNRFILVIIIALALYITGRLFYISIIQNDFYQNKANAYHFGEISISANRGAIYDTNGIILAQSATVYKVFMDPDLFRSELEKKKESADYQQKQVADGKLPEGTTVKSADDIQNEIIDFLAEKLEIDKSKITDAASSS